MNSRRRFIRIASLSSLALAAGLDAGVTATAADLPMVDEKDATAVSLGYVSDSTKANKAKYPNHVPTQLCSNCQLYQGKAGAASGPCPLYAGKQVAAKGWCSAYAKKP
jgi:High potential iron-sulfur protein